MPWFCRINGAIPQQFCDAEWDPLDGGLIYFFRIGPNGERSDEPLTTWSDADRQMPNPHPVILDEDGQANIFVDADAARYRLTDRNGATVAELDSLDFTGIPLRSDL